VREITEVAKRILAAKAQRVGVTGPDGAGKTRFATDLAQALREAGLDVLLAHVDDFHNSRAVRYARGRQSAEGFYRDTTNVAALRGALLDPLAPGGDRRVRTRVFDHQSDTEIDAPEQDVPQGTILLLEGIFLIRPELEGCLEYVIYLDVPFVETFRRMARRDGADPDPFAASSERYRGGQEMWMAEVGPKARADLVIDNSDYLAPKLVARGGTDC
jgi:uridine kinase